MNTPLANIIIRLFQDGGPVMWPIALVLVIAVCVVFERVFWWLRATASRKPADVEKCFAAIEAGDLEAAEKIASGKSDPILRMVHEGLSHRDAAFHGALQSAASRELRSGARFLTALDTIVTIAPLLGLLGTVTGIMASFMAMGGVELEIEKVTGGISEALITTAFGLAIAIVTLVPYNWCNSKLTRLQQDLEFAANSLEVMLAARGWRVGSVPAAVATGEPIAPSHRA